MNKQRGFTLIELLVVIAVIGILASVIMSSLNASRAKARDARRISDLKQIVNALELYYSANGYYPRADCGWDCNGYRLSYDATGWAALASDLAPYIKLPIDPLNVANVPWSAGGHSYSYGNVGRTVNPAQYDLTAQFETNHPLRCELHDYKFYFGNAGGWCGSYHSHIYEASPQ